MNRSLSYALGAIVALSTAASAQQRAESTAAVVRPNGRVGNGRAGRLAAGTGAAGNQQALTRQVRQRFNEVVRRQLNLNDDQSRQLKGVEARIQPQRNQIQRDERQTRLALRAAMQDTAAGPDQTKISGYMSQLVQAQHRRADLLEEEQKELSGFLTPLQRAKYQGLHDQLNKRVQDLRKNAAAPSSPQPPPPR